ncbi:hypothetical protein [Hyphomicrobium sp.]|uniref:hypothetical protein n=1 Tax=Hyphomicrobium sp. TaxID=82 RepID=UPI002FDD7743
MFQGLLKRAERSIDHVIARFLSRALVAVPLIVAAGFATAAMAVKLVELYGPFAAYVCMAVLFAVIGLVTMAVVSSGSHTDTEPETSEAVSAASESGEGDDEGSGGAADFLTPEIRSLLTSIGPAALPPVARGVGRNLPLILFLAVVAYIISRFASTAGHPASQAEQEESEAGDEGGGPAAAAPEAPPAAAA